MQLSASELNALFLSIRPSQQ